MAHRIDGAGCTEDNRFYGGNPQAGIPATVVTDDWLNSIQEEITGVIEAKGITLNKEDNTQLRTAIEATITERLGDAKQRHILRFSLMGTLQVSENVLQILSGIHSGTVKEVGVWVSGSTASATIKVARGSTVLFQKAAGGGASEGYYPYASGLNVAIDRNDVFSISVASINAGSPYNLSGYIIVEEN